MKKIYFLLLFFFAMLLAGSTYGQAFVTTWKTDNTGTSGDTEITIPTLGSATYDYSVDWGDGNSDVNVTGDITHTYASAGTYTVSITGTFPHIYFNGGGDKEKILTVEAWGNIAWTGMYQSFKGCINLNVTATDAPDLSLVTSMQEMFSGATSFNADIDHWDVSNVTTMHNLFSGATSFNQDLNSWDVSSVTSLSGTFANATAFNGNITSWDVSNVTTMLGLFFKNHSFNQPIGNWDVSSVTDMTSVFREAIVFNQDISSWNVANVSLFRLMFNEASSFNQDISGWDVSSGTNMTSMFRRADVFNQPIGSWDVSGVTTMDEMFYDADAFNQDLNGWDVSSVTNMNLMFRFADIFNGDISNWNVSSVTDMSFMFNAALAFNQDISGWDISGVTNMNSMFYDAHAFNQPIGSWNVSSVTNMFNTFRDASAFDQDISGWDVSSVTDMTNVLNTSGITKSNYDKILDGWSQLTLQNNVTFGAAGIEYCYGADARQSIIDNFNWTISDAGEVCNPFVTTWKTDNSGTSNDNQITIPTTGTGYDYTVDWGDGNSDANVTGNIMHTYASAGTYTVTISGDFPIIFFDGEGDKDKILTIEQWGDIAWTSMNRAFEGCSNLTYNATDTPDLSSVTSLQLMFAFATSFNGDLSNWNVSTITNMNSVFFNATSFDGNISTWDVSNVTNLNGLFFSTPFNQDISNWDVSNVTSMAQTFQKNAVFNQDISDWNVSNVTSMSGMFSEASSFNQDLNSWDVSSVQNFASLFFRANAFNGDISNWNVSAATTMRSMFSNATSFNGDLSNWDVSNVTTMNDMFASTEVFNADISGWNTSSVTDMTVMFVNNNAFNQDISAWDVSNVTSMDRMFLRASVFNQDLNSWDVSNVTNMRSIFQDSDLSKSNYDNILEGWSQLTLQNDVEFGAVGIEYCYGAAARQSIIDNFNWTITDAGEVCEAFITTWKTDNTGTSNDDQITIPTTGTGYDYDVDWGDGNTDTGVTGDITHTYASAGAYTVTISGDFPRIYFNDAGDEEKLLTVEQWGDIQWASMQNAFAGCRNMRINATDAPDLSAVTDMSNMFKDCIAFNDPIDHWDVSNVENMSSTFRSAINFNQDLNSWDVSNVTTFNSTFLFGGAFNGNISNWDVSGATDFIGMFNRAHVFNQDLSGWDVSNATQLAGMFFQAFAFDQDISGWDVSGATNLANMFRQATSFNQPIGSWDISSATNIDGMFMVAEAFNQDIDGWDLSSVINLSNMFRGALSFNQDLNSWDVSGLNSLSGLFFGATAFNGKVDSWDVSNVTNFTSVFKDASAFNQDVSGWNVSGASTMVEMFSAASAFDQNLGGWDVSNVTDMTNMFTLSGLSKSNYDKILDGWSQQTLQNGVDFGAAGLEYCTSSTARQSIIDNFSWTITDAGENCIVNIPDANFKAALLANTSINTVDDGEISVQEAEAFTGTMDVNNQGISDLTGIEAFVNLPTLWAWSNNLTSVDLSANTELVQLILNDNNLGTIDLAANTKLGNLQLMNCGLSSGIDVSNLTGLLLLALSDNGFSSIDLSNAPSLSSVRLENTNLTSLDLDANTSLTQLRISGSPISALDLTGLTSLHTFYGDNSIIEELDLSQNGGLTTLSVINNDVLNSIDLRNSNNEDLVNFSVRNTASLTCISVDDRVLARNDWTDVDDVDVFKFSCDVDEIVNIPDVNFKAALLANTSINTTDDGEITVSEADAFTGTISAPSAGIGGLVGIEYFHNITGVTFSSNNLTLADFSNNNKLENVFVNNNAITFLDVDQCPNLVDLRVYNNANLVNLDLSNNPLLEVLWVRQIGLTTLDISANPLIKDIWAADNSLSVIDVSHLASLDRLLIESNNLTSLDLSNNPLLTNVRVFSNDLTELDVRNGANELITTFTATNNPNLTCISVDNPTYSTANWTDIDPASSFSVSCDPNEIVNIPDAAFKAELLANTSINTTDDGEITYGEADAFTGTIDINNLGTVNDLTGVEAFVNLTQLLVSGNNLTSIDVSNLTQLTQLNVTANDLTSLDLSNNTLLDNLSTPQNDLGTLDLSNNPELAIVNISASGLSDIDISANTKLTLFWAAANDLTSIDLSSNTMINNLILSDNQISSLDLSALALTRLEVKNLGLESLNIKNGSNTSLTTFDATGNAALTCITVDDVSYAETNFTNVDDHAAFDLDCFGNTDIVAFSLSEETGPSTINGDGTITIEVVFGTDVTNLTPTISLLNENGSIAPDGIQDFTNPLVYTVTAEDGSTTEDWTVTVSIAPNTETDITAFSLAEQTGAATIDATNHSVSIEVAFGTDVTSLTPSITVSEGANFSPSGAQDFSTAIIYTVTAQDGSTTQDWTVTVTEADNTETDITAFSLPEQSAAATIDAVNHTVDIEVVFGTDLSNLDPTITVSENASISPTGAQDFTSSVTYTVTAQDGSTTQDWTVTVTEADNTETDITAFSFSEQSGPATIDAVNHTVDIEVVFGTDLSNLDPTITVSENASISPTGAQDFTSSVTYTVTAQDGSTTQDWTVTVTEADNTATDITAFSLAEQTGAATINAVNHTVDIEVVFGTDRSNLDPTITVSENASISPTGAQDFTSSVTYTVTAQDGTTTQDWTVTVTETDNTETDIIAFSLAEQTGAATIDAANHTVAIEVAFGTDLSNLDPSITVSENASISPTGAQDFSSTVTYTVTAQDGSTTQDWTVTVTEAPSNETDILTFVLAEQTGPATIDATNNTVDVEVDFNSGLSSLTPTITVSAGASINPGSNVAQNFSGPVTYTVTAADGTSQEWVVTVTEKALGLEDEIEIEVYPNPTSDFLKVTSQREISVKVMDLRGVAMQQSTGQNIVLDVRTLRHGTYLLIIEKGDLRTVRRFIKAN